MFNVTPAAAEQVKNSAPIPNPGETLALRIAARELPNGEIEYVMGFDEQREMDLEMAIMGLNILIGHHSRDLLEGYTLDFVELETGEKEFIFIPPSVESADKNSKAGA